MPRIVLSRSFARALVGVAGAGALACGVAHAQAPLPAADIARLTGHIEVLAADALRGRNAGEPGSEAAAAYIAAHFARLGLVPIGADDSYYQPFTFDVRGADGRRAETVNVVGLLRGADPALAAEVVIIGGHYDHVGTGESADSGRMGGPAGDDAIWNGADDNASGTACVMEAAEMLSALARAGAAPKRSILFILFGAEEHGLLGSRHYVSDPLFPLERTAGMVNLDMVGRNPGDPLHVTGEASASGGAFRALLDRAQREDPGLRLDRLGITLPAGSDHVPFALSRVPALFLSSGLHPDYHRATDHPDKLSPARLGRVARLAAVLAHGLADQDERPSFSFQTVNPFPSLGRLVLRELDAPPVLGVSGLTETEPGVRIGRVRGSSPGARAGLREGDVIRAVDGATLGGPGGIEALRIAVHDADRYGTTRLEIERAGEAVDVVIVWRG